MTSDDLDWKEITTETQFFFYLEQGEIVACRLSDANMFIQKRGKKYWITLQPNRGHGREYSQDHKEKLSIIFNNLKNDLGLSILVLPGAYLEDKPLTKFEKFIEKKRNLQSVLSKNTDDNVK